MPTHTASAPLYDLGGEAIDIDFDRAFRAWQPRSRLSLDELRGAFKFDAHYQRHERGEIQASEVLRAPGVASEVGRDRAFIAEGWTSIYVGKVKDVTLMIQNVSSQLPCHAFTNTNSAHMAVWSKMFPEVVQAFGQVFASHELGLRKPERKAFDHI